MPARGLYEFGDYQAFTVSGEDAATPTGILFRAVSKAYLPPHSGSVGVTLVGDMNRVTTGGIFVAARMGGAGLTFATGTLGPWHQITANGPFASARASFDVDALFAGGSQLEYAKFFAYKQGANDPGGVPQLRSLGIVIDGHEVAALDVGDRALVQFQLNDEHSTDSTEERVLQEWVAELGDVDADVIACNLAALAKAAGGATGTWRVRIGGAPGFPEGTVAATMTTTGASYANQVTNGTAANPRALSMVKLTHQSSVAAQYVSLRGATVTLREAG